MEEYSGDPWLTEVVRFRPPAGQMRYLLAVRREACCFCATGTRTVSFWATVRGRGEIVAWCGHCFNATCESAPLDDDQRARFHAVRAAETETRRGEPWKAVRPAVEDLERRGLL